MPARGVFPTRENCDLDDPQEMFLWMFAALPGVNGGPLLMPIEYFRLVSERLHQLGAMLKCEKCGHMKEPTLEYVPPSVEDSHWATSAGKWVPAGSVTQEEKERRAMATGIARMGHAQKVAFYKALCAARDGKPIPGGKAGDVVKAMPQNLRKAALEVLEADQ